MSKCSFCDKPCGNAWCQFGGNMKEKTIEEKFEKTKILLKTFENSINVTSLNLKELDWFRLGYEASKLEYEEKLKKATDVVSFYAKEANWDYSGGPSLSKDCMGSDVEDMEDDDGMISVAGCKARKFLKEINHE